MEAYRRAHSAYDDARAPIKSPSQIEYQAFARITRNLSQAAELDSCDFPKLAAALHENTRLWTLVASNVAGGGNELPSSLRAQLFYLAEFTRAHTSKVLKGEVSAEALVEINTAVMRGLRRQERSPCPA
ncbi:MAG: flagellar biosynthesis regulator FlaF [Pseudomonadota bacterium]